MNNDTLTKLFMAVVGLILSLIAYWVNGISENQNRVITIVEKVSTLEKNDEKIMAWQTNWERNGQLPIDVEQSSNIKFLRDELQRTNMKLEKLEEVVQNLRLKESRSRSGRYENDAK